MESNEDKGILSFVPDLWNSYWMSRHQIMSRLSKYYKILWISPQIYWRNIFAKDIEILYHSGVKKISNSFWVYTPEYFYPIVYNPKFIGKLSRKIMVYRIKGLLRRMGIKKTILYIWRPEYGSYINEFKHELLLYDIRDEYSFSDTVQPISKEEESILRNADVTFICSKKLIERKASLCKEYYFVPNGVDYTLYRDVIENDKLKPLELINIPEPKIGYVGQIKKQIDLDLILHIAKKRKDWSIVLVGPINKNHVEIKEKIHKLKNEKNVYFIGSKKPDELPAYIANMDVCLMCYKKNSYTEQIYPLKLHEYLACGKPIIATNLESLKEFKEVLNFAEEPDDWIKKIDMALKIRERALEQKRIHLASQNSWDARVELIRKIIDEKMSPI